MTFGWQPYYRNRPTPDLHGRPANGRSAAEPDIPRIQMNVSDAAVVVPVTADDRMNVKV